MLTSALRND